MRMDKGATGGAAARAAEALKAGKARQHGAEQECPQPLPKVAPKGVVKAAPPAEAPKAELKK